MPVSRRNLYRAVGFLCLFLALLASFSILQPLMTPEHMAQSAISPVDGPSWYDGWSDMVSVFSEQALFLIAVIVFSVAARFCFHQSHLESFEDQK
ncbi:hypothetical protein H1S01_05605 [Heliobacterium chlorum]|uniref:Uncharacterized protein n=1 Tax=Heliobacterium chlorum TaxID=2698 RepID=A0ABR7T2U8_HELCL|nr:hypothetical protein [Heliobacterium chlorum]MBC9783986.1 hypothetical protein [Heliobacterium chlorum]